VYIVIGVLNRVSHAEVLQCVGGAGSWMFEACVQALESSCDPLAAR
jgi:hypothetical protein